MSYWVHLQKDGEDVAVENHSEGGTFVVGGTNTAELNVTYNYGKHYRQTLGEGGLRYLNMKLAKDVTKSLQEAVERLGTERDVDYWKATPGNAGYALSILLEWAKQHPDAEFVVE